MPKHLNNADDFEMVAIDRSYIGRAEQSAAHAPLVALGADALLLLAGIQTHFPRSVDLDSFNEAQVTSQENQL